VRNGATDRRAGHDLRPQFCDKVVSSGHAACPIVGFDRRFQREPATKITRHGHIESILYGAINAATVAGDEAFWFPPIKPRFSYQCATTIRIACLSDSGTSSASSPNPTVTSISIPAAIRPGTGMAQGTKAQCRCSKIRCNGLRVDHVRIAVAIENPRGIECLQWARPHNYAPWLRPRIQYHAPILGDQRGLRLSLNVAPRASNQSCNKLVLVVVLDAQECLCFLERYRLDGRSCQQNRSHVLSLAGMSRVLSVIVFLIFGPPAHALTGNAPPAAGWA